MATPRRRSSRIRGNATPMRGNATPLSKLTSLLERDESPGAVSTNIDAVVSTPMVPPNTISREDPSGLRSSATTTPRTISRVPFSEMHPSKVHPSTSKSIDDYDLGSNRSNNPVPSPSIETLTSPTTRDTSIGVVPAKSSKMSSPAFEFTFERPESDLSLEAQKIMDSVRQEAAKIKAQMMEERNKQAKEDAEASQIHHVGMRKIAKPKGKSGRFSDVHRQEFQKMDSIANHASAWKGKIKADTLSLKRSSSRADLDSNTPKSLTKSKSARSLNTGTYDRLGNSSPAKRMRRAFDDDATTLRPVSQESNECSVKTPVKIDSGSNLPSAVTTPTKASLARSASVKSMKTTMIPSLKRPIPHKTFQSPVAPKSEGSNKYLASLSRFGGMKSFLHRSQPKSTDGPGNEALHKPSALPKAAMNLDKELPSLPSVPCKQPNRTSTIKPVDAPGGVDNQVAMSPSKSQIPTPKARNLRLPATSLSKSSRPEEVDPVAYPLIASSPNVTNRRPLYSQPATGPGDFTFRTDKTIEFSSNPSKPLPAKPANTIRHVRPSGLPTPLSASFDSLPTIPHGINNKKRKHADAEDSDLKENTIFEVNNGNKNRVSSGAKEDGASGVGEEEQPQAKKPRLNPKSTISSPIKLDHVSKSSPMKRRFGYGGSGRGGLNSSSNGPDGGKKPGLSLGRLHALARPKQRK